MAHVIGIVDKNFSNAKEEQENLDQAIQNLPKATNKKLSVQPI